MIKFFKELLVYSVANIIFTALLFTMICIILGSPPWKIDNDEPYEFWVVLIALVVIYLITSLIILLIYKLISGFLIKNAIRSFIYSTLFSFTIFWILIYRTDAFSIAEEMGFSASAIIPAILSWFILRYFNRKKETL